MCICGVCSACFGVPLEVISSQKVEASVRSLVRKIKSLPHVCGRERRRHNRMKEENNKERGRGENVVVERE